ncbi:MAG: adenylate/guanylate cyclase domain-containing protein [Chthoniobacterales bacterium]
MAEAPQGTISFLFTDIVGSTKLWERFPNIMGGVIARHDALMRATFEMRRGFVFKTVGDSFCVAFPTVNDAVLSALDLQRAIAAENWGEIGIMMVRMGIHTGTAEFRDGDYFGGTLNRAARIEAAAHGGQILLSQLCVELLSDETLDGLQFKSLGEHRLRNLERPEHLYQAVAEGLLVDFPPPRSMEVLPNNLPVQTTSFIGRVRELEEVRHLLEGTHLLTLVGTGGTGKTRVALETGAALINEFRDGVWLAELAPLTDPARIPEIVANTLGVREEPERPLQETLINFLKGKTILLILDNCEHLLPACATLVSEWLRASPNLKVLAASRHSFGISGETTYHVPPLKILDMRTNEFEGANMAERLSQYDAVKLFIERARAVNPSFSVTNENAPSVAEICTRLDGIPLAIELAAARVRLLSVDQIAARLDDRFRLLKGGNRDGLPHQQTLQALIDWSYDLLSETERILFRRLGVFVVGRTLEALEKVCAGEGVDEADVLDLLQQLMDKSLVAVEYDKRGQTRYTMIESVWQYAREKLEASGEGDTLRNRHMDYFLVLAEEIAPHFLENDQQEWLERFAEERFNFRAITEWAIRSGRIQDGLRLLPALARPVEVRGNIGLVRGYYQALLKHPDSEEPTLLRAHALDAAGRLAWVEDHYDDARKYYVEAIELFQKHEKPVDAALTTCFLAFLNRGDGNIDLAEKQFLQGIEADKKYNEPKLRAVALSGLGTVAQDRGDITGALELKEESLAIYRKLGDRWVIGYILWGVIRPAIASGKIDRAKQAMCEWAQIAQDLHNQWVLPYIMESFAAAALALKESDRAARFFGAAEAMRERYATQFSLAEKKEHEEFIAGLRAQLSEPKLKAAWMAGRDLSSTDALKEARANI